MSDPVLTVAGLRQHVVQAFASTLKELGAEPDPPIEPLPPPDPGMGDFGFPCFALARLLRRAPPLIAQEVAGRLQPDEIIGRVVADRGYVNVHLRPEALFRIVLGQILRAGNRYGSGQADPPRHWMVEYSAPNTNKPLHLGHLRNNLLGLSICRILAFYGHQVTRINLINDRGVHICKSMLAYKKWGAGTDPHQAGKKGDHLVGDFYVRFEQAFSGEYASWQPTEAGQQRFREWLPSRAGQVAAAAAAANPRALSVEQAFFDFYRDDYFNNESNLGRQVREMLRHWEEGDAEVLALWRRLNDWVLDGFEESYRRMGVAFDQVQVESETYKLGKKIVAEGLERGLFIRLPDGAVVCNLEQVGLGGEKVLLRSDGTSVYMTQDLGTAVERFERFKIHRLVYVVGDEQIYHFDVLFRILSLLRPQLAGACIHLAYGMIRLPEGRMKSREGAVVDADDLMDQMHELAREETLSRAAEGKAHTEGLTDRELEHRAEQISMAAIKYFLLKFTPPKSFEYDPKESISFLGQTGPYCLFNYARTRSLLRRVGGQVTFDPEVAGRLGTEREMDLIRLLALFPEVVVRAAKSLDPSRVAEYLFELCRTFAFIFTDKANHPIATCEDPPLRHARLMLVEATGIVLRAGLGLLGIEPLEEM